MIRSQFRNDTRYDLTARADAHPLVVFASEGRKSQTTIRRLRESPLDRMYDVKEHVLYFPQSIKLGIYVRQTLKRQIIIGRSASA